MGDLRKAAELVVDVHDDEGASLNDAALAMEGLREALAAEPAKKETKA